MEERERTSGRIAWVDIAKVLGLLIVLMNHAGLVLGKVNFFGGMFYVPVFFVLAGYTYRHRPQEAFGQFAKKKARRLLVPYFAYNGFLFLFFFAKDVLLGGQPASSFGAPLFGIFYSRSYLHAGFAEGQKVLMTTLNGPTWFLTGMFTALLGFELLLRLTKGNRRRLLLGMAVCLAAGWVMELLPVLLPWSLDTMFVHIVLLGAGYLLAEEGGLEALCARPWKILPVLAVFVVSSLISGSGNLSLREYGSFLPAYLAAALTGSVLACLAARWMEGHLGAFARGLGWLGSHTLAILCLHLFVFMIVQTICGLAGIPAEQPMLQAVMIIGTMVVLAPLDQVHIRKKGGTRR